MLIYFYLFWNTFLAEVGVGFTFLKLSSLFIEHMDFHLHYLLLCETVTFYVAAFFVDFCSFDFVDLVCQSGPSSWPSEVYAQSAIYPMAHSAAQVNVLPFYGVPNINCHFDVLS